MTNSSVPSVARVWVIDDDASIRWVLEKALQRADLDVRAFASASEALNRLAVTSPDVIVTDIRMPELGGLQLLDRLQQDAPQIPIIVITAHTDLDSAVASYRRGAFEYLPKPFDIDDAVALVKRAIDHSRNTKSRIDVPLSRPPGIIGEATAMQDVFRAVGRLAGSDMNVLILGESGTGKELLAQALYDNSPRNGNAYVALNTAAIPAELLESELFGHERGAFTGAHAQRIGRFEQADGGTLFLDEIGDMPEALQTRLLRVLSDGQFYRVGGHRQLRVDVRILAATNQNLEARVAEGRFREDLYHRLNVIRIALPPLRDRRDDIPTLARNFMAQAAAQLNVKAKSLRADTEQQICRYDWPGNVRQLENVCRWLTVMAPGQIVSIGDLPPELSHNQNVPHEPRVWQRELRRIVDRQLALGELNIAKRVGEEFERVLIESTLHYTGGHRQDAARRLGWGRNTLTRKIKDLDIDIS
ncbi:MAG: nitrogen regulation protein NR(I) [Gammaproteobacteria bacterium]|nr:nitrogen regulation protein NR(I) [Gammaproteobacteria bacterium]MDH3464423.1 nitrogen regulation protein NR(I) [Gammaproteobacteria bacterium]